MISKATISFIQSLKQKKYRQKYNKFILEGEKIVIECLLEKTVSFDSLYCLESKAHLLDHITNKYNIISEKTLSKISNLKNPPGLFAIANVPDQPDISTMSLSGIVLYLDSIKDPGNMGTIIRTADWFGVKTIIASPESVEFYNPKVIQASMGSIGRVSLINAHIHDFNFQLPLVATTLSGQSIREYHAPTDMILVIGSESHGVSQEILGLAKDQITIPKSNESSAESLNAGIATAIILSHFC